MALRLVFSHKDLARVRLAPASDPLWELTLSVHRLHRPRSARSYEDWTGWVRTIGSSRAHAAARVLGTLIPVRGYFPDFLTPPEHFASIDEGIDIVVRTPRRRLREELGRLDRLPQWGQGLRDGARAQLDGLAAALRTYHDVLIGPHWNRIGQRLDADRNARVAQLLAGGTERMLSGFGPLMRWRAPVLEVDYPVHREVHLGGRGLLLVPSFFCHLTPVSLADDDLPPVLVYPVDPDPDWMRFPDQDRHLEALLGRTRAAVLRSAAYGSSTSQIARRLRVSPASVSEHVGVLRDSGLLASRRQGRSVLHCPTRLGSGLVRGCLDA